MGPLFDALVIHENREVVQTLKKFLSRLGCHVRAAYSEEKSLSELRSARFSIVFVALVGRTISGREIARWIKTHCGNTRVVIVTSWRGELETTVLALEGIHGVIHKPLMFGEVRDMLLELLG